VAIHDQYREVCPSSGSHEDTQRRRRDAFETLAAEGINIELISTSEIKISVVINGSPRPTTAARAAHAAFGLEKL